MARPFHRPAYSPTPYIYAQAFGPRASLPGQAYVPNLNRAALRGAAATKRLAQDLGELAAIHGAALDKDLETLGWKKAQLTAHVEAARELAQQSAVREVA